MGAELIRAAATLTLFLALTPSIFGQDNCIRPRIISVNGTAEMNVAPDEVILTLGVESHDKDLTVAKANNDSSVKKVLALTHAAGIEPKNIQTSALNMGPEYSEERIPKLLGYRVSQIISVTLVDLSKYEDLLTDSLKAGANRVYGINFVLADPKKFREEARLKAVRAAREKATTMAAELGQKLGQPTEVIEAGDYDAGGTLGNLAVNNRNFITMASLAPGEQAEPTIAEGVITIRASVRVSFQLE